MNHSKKNLDQLAKKMELLNDMEQNQLKGGFAAFGTQKRKELEHEGSVSVTVSGNCGCSCEVRN
ncbi:hypothetical protein [Myroides odoratus]|uniref:hypothetical protein n=1 Tax=Myroides odoratus TaxID=256 RepID=UPI0039B00EE8